VAQVRSDPRHEEKYRLKDVRIRRIFAWAVEEEWIPPSVIIALATVAGLEEG
jgi:hypothetical protein